MDGEMETGRTTPHRLKDLSHISDKKTMSTKPNIPNYSLCTLYMSTKPNLKKIIKI